MSLNATFLRLLSPYGDGDSTAALDSLCQGLTLLLIKKFFLISNLTLSGVALAPLCEKRQQPSLHPPCSLFLQGLGKIGSWWKDLKGTE